MTIFVGKKICDKLSKSDAYLTRTASLRVKHSARFSPPFKVGLSVLIKQPNTSVGFFLPQLYLKIVLLVFPCIG